jgi:MFS family permease
MRSLASMRRMWVLMGTVFIDMIGFLVVLPLLPFYGKRFDASETVIGLLIAIFAFAQLTSAPLWGRLSDRLGRRPVILGSLLLSGAAFALFGLTPQVHQALGPTWALALLFVSRLVQGLGGGTTGVLQAYVSDSVQPDLRTQALGWVTAATSAGVMLGPLIGSFAFRFGEEAPGFFAASLCLLNFLFAWRLLPESAKAEAAVDEAAPSQPSAGAAAEAPRRTSLGRAILRVLSHPGDERSRLILVYACGMMAFMAMNGVMVLYLDQAYGVTEQNIGWFYAYVGGLSLLMRALLLGPINQRLGDVRTLRVGTLCLVIGMACLPLPRLLLPRADVPALIGLAVAVFLVPVGTALLFPATTSLVSRLSLRNETGQNLGVQQAFGGVSRMLGPIWATAVFQFVGISAPFWLASGLMVGVLAMTFGIQGPARRDPDPAPREAKAADALPIEPA